MHKRNVRIVLGVSAVICIALVVYFVANRGENILFKSLDQGIQLRNSRFIERKPAILVFNNVKEIGDLLPQIVPHLPGVLPVENQLQQLDYGRFFAVLVLQGLDGGNSSIQVQNVSRKGNQVIVRAIFVTPRSGEGQTANGTDAYHLIAIPKDGDWDQQIEFYLVDDRFFGGTVANTTHLIP